MILRNKEKDILKLLSFFPAIGIIGPKQVGKTTLAKELINKKNKPRYCTIVACGNDQ